MMGNWLKVCLDSSARVAPAAGRVARGSQTMNVTDRAAESLRAEGVPVDGEYQRLDRWMRFVALVRRGVVPAPYFWLGAEAEGH